MIIYLLIKKHFCIPQVSSYLICFLIDAAFKAYRKKIFLQLLSTVFCANFFIISKCNTFVFHKNKMILSKVKKNEISIINFVADICLSTEITLGMCFFVVESVIYQESFPVSTKELSFDILRWTTFQEFFCNWV